jgi:hypothetical protein
MRSFENVVTKYYSGHQIKDDEIGGEYGRCRREDKSVKSEVTRRKEHTWNT